MAETAIGTVTVKEEALCHIQECSISVNATLVMNYPAVLSLERSGEAGYAYS